MLRKMMVASGGIAVLSAGVLIGGLTTGLVGAHSAQTAPAAQATPAADGETADGPANAAEAPDTTTALPAGSVSADQAKQAAIAYVQQTTPYSSQGLQAQTVQIDDENGTILFSVDFSNSAQQELEVQVGTNGSVIGVASADAGAQGQDAADGQSAASGQSEAPDGEQADGPAGAPTSPTPAASGAVQLN